MSRKCTVCSHPKRAAIDKAIVSGASNRDIARQFGAGEKSVQRHRAHIKQAIIKARDAGVIRAGKTGYERWEGLYVLADEALRRAANDRDAQGWHQVLARYLELAHKLGVEEKNAMVLDRSPEWMALRMMISTALLPFPEARAAVLAAIRANRCSTE